MPPIQSSPINRPVIAVRPVPAPRRVRPPGETKDAGEDLEKELQNLSLREDGEDKIKFQVLEKGSKKCRDMLVDNKGYTYNLKRQRNQATRDWQCSVRGKTNYCPASVKERDGTFILGSVKHNHPGNPGIQVAKQIKAQVKAESIANVFQSCGTIAERVLFNLGDADLPQASRPKLSNLVRVANRAREQLRPKDPRDIHFEIAQNYIPDDFLKADISADDQRHLIFATEEGLSTLCDLQTWFVDGTFKVVRDPFVQLFTIHGFISNDDGSTTKQVPLAFIFMSRRQTADYKQVLEELLRLLPRRAAVQSLVADFEKATWAAARHVIPGVAIRGCNFHWGQAIWRKTQEIGLQVDYNQHGKTHQTVRLMMSLPFVPVDQVWPVFHQVIGNIQEGKLRCLGDYIMKQWISSKTFPPETWNVFKLPTRTNNDCEGWHRRLNYNARDSTPPFYELVPILYDEAAKLPLQRQMVTEGTLARLQRRSVRERQGQIFQLWDRYEAHELTAYQLLSAVATVVGPVTN